MLAAGYRCGEEQRIGGGEGGERDNVGEEVKGTGGNFN